MSLLKLLAREAQDTGDMSSSVKPSTEEELRECNDLELKGLLRKRTVHAWSLTDAGLRLALSESARGSSNEDEYHDPMFHSGDRS